MGIRYPHWLVSTRTEMKTCIVLLSIFIYSYCTYNARNRLHHLDRTVPLRKWQRSQETELVSGRCRVETGNQIGIGCTRTSHIYFRHGSLQIAETMYRNAQIENDDIVARLRSLRLCTQREAIAVFVIQVRSSDTGGLDCFLKKTSMLLTPY